MGKLQISVLIEAAEKNWYGAKAGSASCRSPSRRSGALTAIFIGKRYDTFVSIVWI
jgi:hypothetical protein